MKTRWKQGRESSTSQILCSLAVSKNLVHGFCKHRSIAAKPAGRTRISHKLAVGVWSVLYTVFPCKAALIQILIHKIGNADVVAGVLQQHDSTGTFTAGRESTLADIFY